MIEVGLELPEMGGKRNKLSMLSCWRGLVIHYYSYHVICQRLSAIENDHFIRYHSLAEEESFEALFL